MRYENVLVAIDIGAKDSSPLLEAAMEFADPARLTLAHVICLDLEHYARTDRLHSASMEEAYWSTRHHLATLCAEHGVDTERQRILEGNIVTELTHLVESEDIDLIIAGRHERSSPASTIAALAARAPCDLLGVTID